MRLLSNSRVAFDHRTQLKVLQKLRSISFTPPYRGSPPPTTTDTGDCPIWACHIFLQQSAAAESESEHQGPFPNILPSTSLEFQSKHLDPPDTLRHPAAAGSKTFLRHPRPPLESCTQRSLRCAAKRQRGPETSPLHSKLTPQLLSRRLAPVSAGPAPPQSDAISGSTQLLLRTFKL